MWKFLAVWFIPVLWTTTICAQIVGSDQTTNPPKKSGWKVGAAVVDVSPTLFPVLINGSMVSRQAEQIRTPVNARAIVVQHEDEEIAIVVVDSCMIPKVLLDDIKHRASERTNLQPDHILISATHTHSAPSSFGALGTDADMNYIPLLRERVVESIVTAESKLQPARIGWGSGDADDFNAVRRWIRRPDRLADDPFGNPTVRANMHAARNLDDVTGPSGPDDPELSMIAFESPDGLPIAVLANFSMHYFSDKPISADYFGLFCDRLQSQLMSEHPQTEDVVVALSHGCSGDIWRRDYTTYDGKDSTTIDSFTNGLLQIASDIYDSIKFSDAGPLAMAESRLPMKYRVPDQQLLESSQKIVDALDGELPKTRPEIYAREQVFLHELQSTEVVVQGIRLGNIGIVITPNETYALTGLKFKHQSPLPHTMVIELANGADGYIPPPEQHVLGGYNTWAARSAGLEVQAEPRIVAAGLSLLEHVSQQPRMPFAETTGPRATAIQTLDPVAHWRMADMQGPLARDASGQGHHGIYEPGVVFFLEGPQSQDHAKNSDFVRDGQVNRSAHFAGGRMRANLPGLGNETTVSLWFWNGMPNDAREVTGWLVSRDHPNGISLDGEHLGLSGNGSSDETGGPDAQPGRLVYQHGMGEFQLGTSEIERWTWNHVLLVRRADRVQVYLNGNTQPEIDAALDPPASNIDTYFFGGRSDNHSNWEGRLDEIAIFDRAIEPTSLP